MAINVEVHRRKNEPIDKLIKRFKKKLYKSEVLKEFIERSRFKSESEKRNEAKRNRKREIEKERKKRKK